MVNPERIEGYKRGAAIVVPTFYNLGRAEF